MADKNLPRQVISSTSVQKPAAPTPRGRGRPRAYDPEAALRQATLAFWRSGYASTSLDALTEATGMNRPSLYAAYGDKHAWYLAALERYVEGATAAMRQLLDRDEPLRSSLQRLFEAALAMYLPEGESARGCLLSGTAATEAVADDGIREALGRGLRRVDDEFRRRFERAQSAGELPAGTDVALRARLASALLHSTSLRARAGDARSDLAATVAAGIGLLCAADC